MTKRSRLKPALISSFCARGYAEAFKHWPRDVAIDLYCFMQSDLGGQNAAAYLAELADDKRFAADRADSIIKSLKDTGRMERIVALSSFLPQIWRRSNASQSSRLGIAPVLGLVALARALREREHMVTTIELVSGTRIGGLWHGRWAGDKPHPSGKTETFFAFRDTDAVGPMEHLCNTLAAICEDAKLDASEGIRFALELEPGPLYVLNNCDSLSVLEKHLSKRGLEGIAGFNLDIAHWQLAHVCQGMPAKCADFMRSVVHAHISDHAKGHFGDVPIGDLGFEINPLTHIEERLAPFRRWLDQLATAWFDEQQKPAPWCSGYVSIEMEACRGIDAIQQSVRVLRGLLSE